MTYDALGCGRRMTLIDGDAGLAIDRAHGRLFSGRRSKHLAISDIRKGKLITTLPIGAGVDAAAFDSGTQNAFASNGDGTLSVVHEDSPDRFHLVQTVTTIAGSADHGAQRSLRSCVSGERASRSRAGDRR